MKVTKQSWFARFLSQGKSVSKSHEEKYGKEYPDANWKTLLLPFLHPAAFFRGGLKAAYDERFPYVIDARYQDVYNAPLASYMRRYIEKPFLKEIRWMGVNALKQVSDLWVYQEILYETKPDIVVEIGSHKGGTTLFLAHMMDILGHGEILSLDITHDHFLANHPRVTKITGDCSSPEVFESVKKITSGKKTMVIHDGDHTTPAVLRDLQLYAPLVTEGQYFIVEDGHVDVFNPARVKASNLSDGPMKAVLQYLEKNAGQFEIDDSKERFLLTFNPRGYLKRLSVTAIPSQGLH